MGQITNFSVLVSCLSLIAYVGYKIKEYITCSRIKRENGCLAAPSYHHRDFIFGLDLLYDEKKAFTNSGVLELFKRQFAKYGKTFGTNFCGTRTIRTMDPRNIQTVLALKFNAFGVQPFREGVAEPFFGHGINTTDGTYWEYSRSLVKPTFNRAEICNFASLEQHLSRFFDLLPQDGSTVDLQPLFSRLFLDTGTEFLFGKSANSLSAKTSEEDELFIRSYDYVMVGFGIRVRMGRWLKNFHRDKAWFEAVRTVHRYMDQYIDKAIKKQERARKNEKDAEEKPEDTSTRYVLLDEMAKQTQDKANLRSQILAVFMPSRDTTSWLVNNVFHALVRNPKVYETLRREISAIGCKTLTFEVLKSMKYLQWVMNESHRMYPVSDSAPRICLSNSVLPAGGGPDGKAPIFVKKGEKVLVNMYCMHQDKEIWGEDVEEFRPERWEKIRPMWAYIPFGGGPRTCPAQQLVHTEAAYVITRIMQKFAAIENRDPNPWTETWRIGPLSKYGVQVALTLA